MCLKGFHIMDPKLASWLWILHTICTVLDIVDTHVICRQCRTLWATKGVKGLKRYKNLLHTKMHEVPDPLLMYKSINTGDVLLMITTRARMYTGQIACLLILLPLCSDLWKMWGFQTAAISLTGLELQLFWKKRKGKTTTWSAHSFHSS